MKDSKGRLFVFTVLLAILFTSCGVSVSKPYLSQQGYFDMSVVINGSHPLVYDSVLKIKPSFSQKLYLAKHQHAVAPAIILCAISLGLIGWGIYYSSNAGKKAGLPVVAFLLAIALFCGAFETIDQAHTKEIEILKVVYDSVQKVPGGLDHYIDENILK